MNKAPGPGTVTKILHVQTKEFEPTEADLRRIRPYLLRDFGLNDLYIREMWLANDQVDRSFERFDSGYLRRFKATVAGKSVLVGHDSGSAPVGRFFDARMEQDEQGWNWVVPRFYMPISPGNELARDSIDSGVWSYVSVGAHVDWRGLICDICKRSYYYGDGDGEPCPHYAGEVYDGEVCTLTFDSKRSDMEQVEAVEGSIVYLGCQYDAAIRKSDADRGESRRYKGTLLERFAVTPPQDERGEDTPPAERAEEDSDMAELADVQAKLDARIAEVDTLTARITELEAERDKLQGAAADGVRLRGNLVDEIKRLCACVGETLVPSVLDKITDIDELLRIEADLSAKWAEKREVPHGESEGTSDTKQAVRPALTNAGII